MIKNFSSYINEKTNFVAEVNIFFQTDKDKKEFIDTLERNNIKYNYGKNRYADTITLTGDKIKILKILKSFKYSEDEIVVK